MSFNRPQNNEDSAEARDKEIDSLIGRRVGIYRLQKRIGKGGMGAVYLADRDDGEFHQQVAVKLIKRGMDTDFVLNRFRHERQILASLEHPFIARLLDGGTTDDGLPYFVMDFIKGESLIEFCEKNDLDLRGRLELFRRVCEAVGFAHQKQIIHRDLKPTNILVTANGTPKLLDFGIAKMLNPDETDETLMPTATQMRLMTAEYAAPEQIRGEEITPATDVYSLGVLLYELMTGARPYKFSSRAPHDIARVICEVTPLRPLAIGRQLLKSKSSSGERQTTGGGQPADDDSLERIILKSLQKKSQDRYLSVKEFSADIERFLNGQSVLAQQRISKTKSIPNNYSANPPTGSRSIAVLPLKFFGSTNEIDTDDRFLSLGLADALIARLSSVRRFVLRPTSSILRYGEAGGDSFTAGEELGVEFVVDGHIQKLGDRLRISVQLLNVAERTTVWAERFDEKFTDVLELEDAISNRVAESLIPRLTGEERRRLEKRGTNNPQAYEAYLRGRYFYNKFTGEDLPKAVEAFREAIRLDSNYALPHVGIADFFAWSAIFGEMPSREAFPQAAAAARRALEIDSGLGEAYTILAFTTYLHDWDRDEGLRLVRKAIELSPNYGFAHECYSNFLASSGQSDEAIVEIKRAEELDPLSPRPKLMTAWTLYQTRHFNEGVAKARRANALEKDFPQGLLHLGNALTAMGETEEAVRVLEESYRLWSGSGLPGYMLCHALVAAGRREEARKILSELHESAAARHVKPYFLAMAHTALDERDEAFGWFEKALTERNEWMIWFGTDVKLDSLHEDSRYQDLLRRTKNPLAQPKNFEIEKPATGGEKSIAVLPLKLFGSPIGSDDEYLGIGLADALVSRLSNMRRFVVRPTSSVLPFNNAGVNPFQAGHELGVDYVLDGNIRRVGERIRVSIQLLDIGENSSRWAEKFSEHFTDVIELEDSISERVVKSLLPQLTGDEEQKLARRGTDLPDAYEAYLRGRFYWNQFTPESLPKSLESFQNAVRLDPNYALAYVGLSDFYIWANIYGIIPSLEATGLAEVAARRAIELNEQQGEAYATLGLINQNRMKWAEANRLYETSLKLLPNYIHAHEWCAAYLVGSGNFEAGAKEIKLAERLDPLSLRTKTLVAWTLYQAQHYDEALEIGKQIVDLDKNYPQGYAQIGNNLLVMGRAEEALANFQKFDLMIPQSALAKYQLCFALVAANRFDEARQILDEIKTLAAAGYVKPYFLAMAHAALDERDTAFENFELAFAEVDPWMLWFGTEPLLDRLRDDVRYFDLLRRMNNPIVEQQIKPKNPDTSGKKSIAVLPLKFIGAAEDEYMAVGLADAMITKLSGVRRFIVRPTSSVLRFAASSDSFAAGRELGVDFVLDGTIRRAGQRIRISGQLLDINSNSTLWAESFDEDFTGVLELEDLVAEKVARLLVPKLTGEEQQKLAKRGTNKPAAFEAYLRGRYHLNLFTPENFARAKDYLEQAIALDSEYALAYVGLADYYFVLGTFATAPPLECYAKSRIMAERAIAIDDTLGEAYAILGFTYFADFDMDKVEKTLRRGIELNPNHNLGRVWYSVLLTMQGKSAQAIAEAKQATELNPLSSFDQQHYAWILYQNERFEEAIAWARRTLSNDPDFSHALGILSWILRHVGQIEESLDIAKRAVELNRETPWLECNLAATHAVAGDTDKARELLRELENKSTEKYISPFCLAIAHCNLGDTERAFALLENAFATRDVWLMWLSSDPQIAHLRNDDRYFDLLRRMGNPAAQ